jgi:hypothetical protein
MVDSFLLNTAVVQLVGAAVLVTPLIIRKRMDYLPGVVGGAISIFFASFYCLPSRWRGMELVTLGYFMFFLFVQGCIYALICMSVVVIRNLREDTDA